ncbi:SDR family oxidoreductase [Enhygromyxa salina]|uniref:SDR family oxidoreductase n=1 Tax=Enhygromyxa salina TaxID=215803 RepID=UPI0015E6C133|nr:SDR family oxidoreductase [Enhygromyxa salina]
MATRDRPSVLISGAARGIGLACAERFADAGYFVGLYDLDAKLLAGAVEQISHRWGGDRCCHAALDVRDHDAVLAAVAHFAEHTGGRMNVLLNNAGVMSVGRFETVSAAEHQRTIAVNLQGVIELTHASFELLRRTEGARVINMSSIAAIHGVPEMASYSATKHAVRGFTEALELEWAGDDIRVCDVMPAFVDTNLLSSTTKLSAEDLLGVRLSPADVAQVVWQAATSKRRRTHWPVGPQATLAYRVDKLAPAALVRSALKWMTKL